MKNNLITIGNINTIDSTEIANMLEIEHWQVLRKLEGTKDSKGYIKILNDNNFVVVDYFIKSSYIDNKGEERPCYLFTRLGCDFIANKFTGEKGILFTAKYVKRFQEMEKTIKESKQPIEKSKTLEIKEMNARVRVANMYYKLSNVDTLSKE